MELTQHRADAFARMPLTYLRREYPNHIMHLLNDDGDVLPPRELHPIFMAVLTGTRRYGYWLLLRCLRLYPELSCRDDISRCLPTISRQKTWRRSWLISTRRSAPRSSVRMATAGYWHWPGAETVIAAAGGRLVSNACAVNAGHSQPSGGLPQ